MKRIRQAARPILLLLAVSVLAGAAAPSRPAPPTADEISVRALLIYRLLPFVEWPADTVRADKAPLVIGVYGTNPFGKVLEDIVRNEVVNGHPIVITPVTSAEAAKKCQVLYVSGRDDRSETALLNALKGLPILTIGDRERFLDRGGMIYVYTNVDNTTRLRVNKLTYLRACEVNIAAKVLRLSQVEVTPED